jgi:hypothetical protein
MTARFIPTFTLTSAADAIAGISVMRRQMQRQQLEPRLKTEPLMGPKSNLSFKSAEIVPANNFRRERMGALELGYCPNYHAWKQRLVVNSKDGHN